MNLTLAALATGLLALSGCAQQRFAEATAAIDKQAASCKAQYPGTTHYVDRMNCIAPTVRTSYASVGTDSDLVEIYLADWAQMAAQVDAGRMTKEEANAALVRTKAGINQVQAERKQQQTMTALAILSAMPRPQYQPVPFYEMHTAAPSLMLNRY